MQGKSLASGFLGIVCILDADRYGAVEVGEDRYAVLGRRGTMTLRVGGGGRSFRTARVRGSRETAIEDPEGIRSGRSPGPWSALPAEARSHASQTDPQCPPHSSGATGPALLRDRPLGLGLLSQGLRAGHRDSDLFGRRSRAEPDVLLRAGLAGGAKAGFTPTRSTTRSPTQIQQALSLVYLENEYVRIGILPEIGGRLFEAVDKSNGYNFIYRQHVIKPALIGLIGAWISGGIEWNIPHHHRATTFLPVQYRIARTPTAARRSGWANWRCGTGCAGPSAIRCARASPTSKLGPHREPHPGGEHDALLCQRGGARQQGLPGDLSAGHAFVTFHGKREFTTWPIGHDAVRRRRFRAGMDVSWYTNHIEANSMFAWNYEDDFFAGYDHGKQAGIMSFADHHVVPGKKFWTWGNGPRGRMWDKILTDEDGPYIELMVGAYSDNQPDYSWLQPYETKAFEMYWYPFRDIGGVKKANLEAAVNLEVAQPARPAWAFARRRVIRGQRCGSRPEGRWSSRSRWTSIRASLT